jgi:hypothetical protein
LIVCRDGSSIPLIAGLQRPDGLQCVIASDDPAVHAAGRRLPFVSDVCWLEGMGTIFATAAPVEQLRGIVNRWLEALPQGIERVPSDLVAWLPHVEGGDTVQRLQDAVVLIDSYLELISRYDVARIVVLSGGRCWEDDVLRAVATSRRIPVETVANCRSSSIASGVRMLKAFGRPAYRLMEAMRGLRRVKAAAADLPAEPGLAQPIVFQLAHCSDKHIENVAPLMIELERLGHPTVALTCLAPDTGRRARAYGLRVQEVAAFLPRWALVFGLVDAVRVLVRACRRASHFREFSSLSYRHVPLGGVLWPIVLDYLSTELVARHVMAAGLKAYFSVHRPVAMKLWGEISLYEGYLAWKLSANRPFWFDYWIGVNIDSPYWSPDVPIDLFFAAGPFHVEFMKRIGIAADRIASVGSLRYAAMPAFADSHTPADSRRHLGVPEGYDWHVLWDRNSMIRGFMSNQEQLRVAAALLQVVGPSCALIVKPHPSSSPGLVETLLPDRRGHVFTAAAAELPYHAINAADIVVTKISSIGVEAMLMGKPVVLVSLDGEPKWREVFGADEGQVTSEAELVALLTRLRDDRSYRAAWTAERLARQRGFLSRYFDRRSDPTAAAARIISARLTKGGEAPAFTEAALAATVGA